jgi:23S rRNA A2030 N6-methylase RlmJ
MQRAYPRAARTIKEEKPRERTRVKFLWWPCKDEAGSRHWFVRRLVTEKVVFVSDLGPPPNIKVPKWYVTQVHV